MSEHNTPVRMCVGCSARKPKRQMLRIVKGADGQVQIDDTHHAPGRGAYICHKDCIKKIRKNRRLQRNLQCKISEEFLEKLEQEMDCFEQTVG